MPIKDEETAPPVPIKDDLVETAPVDLNQRVASLVSQGMTTVEALKQIGVQAVTSPATPEPPVPPEEHCVGCGKTKRIDTHHNKKHEPVCHVCNMMMIRKEGPDYGDRINDIGAYLSKLRVKKDTYRERRPVRQLYNTLVTIFEVWDLEFDQQVRVMAEFRNVFSDLPEAARFFTN